jgi:hypothetical protein
MIAFDGGNLEIEIGDGAAGHSRFIPVGTTTDAKACGYDSASNTMVCDGETTGVVPTEEVIAEAATITADACGGVKQITTDDGGQIWTNTTNTFTAPSAANEGCWMYVCNSGTDTINLDDNALFEAGANIALVEDMCVLVASSGAGGVWHRPAAMPARWNDLSYGGSNLTLGHAETTTTFTWTLASEANMQDLTLNHNNNFAETSTQTILMLNYLNNAITADLERALTIQNQDGDDIDIGIYFSTPGAGNITTAINASAAKIGTALNIGQNKIETSTGGILYSELDQLLTINTTTISANQWAALGGMSETVTSTDINRLDDKDAALVDVDDVVGTAITGTSNSSFAVNSGVGNTALSSTSLVFEGSGAADANDLTVSVTNPTAPRTITLPDASGTVAFLASPIFTGDPTGPDPATTDDDQSLATTAYVKNQEHTVCKTIETLVVADDNIPLHHFNGASTIIKIACHGDAATTISMQDLAGDDIDDAGDLVCSTGTGSLTWDSSFTAGTQAFTDGEGIEFDTISASTPTWTTVCFAYTTP